MKKIISLILCLWALSTYSQAPPANPPYSRPNVSYGNEQYRIVLDSTLLIPTVCGAPTNLHGKNIGHAGLVYDSCGHVLYTFDPTDSTFTAVGGGGSATTIYNGDGTLAGDRLVSMGSNTLRFGEFGTSFFMDPVSKVTQIYNSSGDDQFYQDGTNHLTRIYANDNTVFEQNGTGWILSNGNFGIGTGVTPSAKLEVDGSLKFVTGNEGAGKVLTSDASGNADWSSAGGSLGLQDVITNNPVLSATNDINDSDGTHGLTFGSSTAFDQIKTFSGFLQLNSTVSGVEINSASAITLSSSSGVNVTGIAAQHNAGDSMVVINTATGDIGWQVIPSGGGGDLQSVTNAGASTTNSMQVTGDNKYLGISSLIAFGSAFLTHNETAGGNLALARPSGATANLAVDSLTGNRNFQYPDASGTLALRSDIPASSNLTFNTSQFTLTSDTVSLSSTILDTIHNSLGYFDQILPSGANRVINLNLGTLTFTDGAVAALQISTTPAHHVITFSDGILSNMYYTGAVYGSESGFYSSIGDEQISTYDGDIYNYANAAIKYTNSLNQVQLTASAGTVLSTPQVTGIDLSGGTYAITGPGTYYVSVGSLSNALIFPSATSYTTNTIDIYVLVKSSETVLLDSGGGSFYDQSGATVPSIIGAGVGGTTAHFQAINGDWHQL